MHTKSHILAAVRQAPLTIAQLCSQLGITRTAVSLQLKQLVAAGHVRASHTPRIGQVGKPSIAYEAAAGTEDIDSLAYQPLFTALLAQIKISHGEATMLELLENTGRNMARSSIPSNLSEPEDKIQAAMAVAAALGASTQLVKQADGTFLISNHTCPAATSARAEARVCHIFASFFAEATDCKVLEKCARNERIQCHFQIEAPAKKVKQIKKNKS